MADDAMRSTAKRGIALGFGLGAVLYAAGYVAWPATTEDPVRFALWLSAAPALFVYAVFFSCLRLRDTPEAIDPLHGGESMRWKINQRVLTNSVEQLAIFVPLLLALATRVDAAHAKLLPLHVASWVLARIVFWWGYRKSTAWRAPGMSWTNLTTAATIAWLVRFSA